MTIIIPGVQRCGTSSLRRYLSRHPSIQPPRRGGIEYFSERYVRGSQWYESQTDRLDKSPNYLANPVAPSRIARDLPDARFIVLLRDPIARIWSHYRLARKVLRETRPFRDAIHSGPGRSDGWHSYLKRGHYAEQLSHWSKFIPLEHIFVVQSERFFTHTADVYKEIVRFLGLDSFAPEEFRQYNAIPARDGMGRDVRRWLAKYYREHNETLYSLLDRDLGWN